MKVVVQLYAQLREIAGVSELNIDLGSEASVNDLLDQLYEQRPALRAQDRSILIGAGVQFVDRGYKIKPGEVISIMPPVQGG